MWYKLKDFSLVQLVINDGLKMILGISGSFLALVGVNRLDILIKKSKFYDWMTNQGRFTLDIYLLQIIIIEKLFGPWYQLLVRHSSVNWICDYGLLWKTVSTICVGTALLILIIFVDKILQRNAILVKILFWK